MAEPSFSSPHLHGPNSVSRVMMQVILALVPAIAAYVWYFGWGVLVNIVFASVVALACEALVLTLRRRPILPFLSDGSALVTAVLLGMILPPLSPWWLVLVGVAFAIIIAKHLYGGLGYNPFNPAMIGYVVLLISFPVEMTRWMPPHLPHHISIDAIGMATPLDTVKVQLGLHKTVEEIHRASPVFGHIGGKGWEVINGLILLGGLWLLYRRIITWQVPVGMLGALLIIATIFHIGSPDTLPSPLFHLASGGAMLGAFFIATDPVSGATSPRGRLLFGIGVGLFTYIIRTWGGYPDGVAFSVLLMNMAAPSLDYFTQPRVFGHGN